MFRRKPRDLPVLPVPHHPEQFRPIEEPAVRHRGDHLTCLNGADEIEPLTDGVDKTVTRIPGFLQLFFLPCRRRDEAGLFIRKPDPCQAAQSEIAGVPGDDVEPDPFSHGVEVNVTGFHQGPVHAHGTVPPFFPAPIGMPPISDRAVAGDLVIREYGTAVQPGQCHNDLKGGARGIDALDRPVVQREGRIVRQPFPVFR